MIADSLEHAFDDMSERVWTETRLKAEEMLAGVEKGLAIAGERCSPNEQRIIREKAAAVRLALKRTRPGN